MRLSGLALGLGIGMAAGAALTAFAQGQGGPAPAAPGPLALAAQFIKLQPPAIDWRWPDSLVAQSAAPRNHKVLYEDGHVALLEVTIRPGETEILHGHKYPSVFAVDAMQPKGDNAQVDGRVLQVSRSLEGLTLPTCAAIGPQAPHQFHNTDSFPQHFYRIEFKRIDGDKIMDAKYGQ